MRSRRRLVLLAMAASLLGLGGAPGALAQDSEDAPLATGEELFGAYQLEARGVGVQARYELQDILPGGAPLLDLTIPETATRFTSGPTGYGLAGLAYPGPLLADLGVLLAQTGAGEEDSVPPWPIKAEAFYPTGPTEVDESQGPAVQQVVTGDLGVQALGSFPPIEAAPVLEVGSLRAATRSSIEGDLAVSRTRVELGSVRLLAGLLTIESIVTDLVAAHDGEAGSTAGGTTVSGVRLLGLAAELDEGGFVLAAAPSDDPLGGPLADLVGPLGEALGPVTEVLDQVLDQAVPAVDDLLAQAGLTLEVLDPHESQTETGAATRISSGLTLRLSYEGTQQAQLKELIDAIPAELKPSLGPVPNPIGFLVENHIMELSLAPATVTALATPPFPAFDAPPPPPPPAAPELAPPTAGDVPTLGAPGFSTPIAPVPSPPAGGGGSASSPALGADPVANVLSGAVPALLVALAALATPLFGLGSSRLADTVLAAGDHRCPYGLDRPPPSGGPP